MKKLVFLRGIDSPLKQLVKKSLLDAINPSVNAVNGIAISINAFLSATNGEVKAADRTAKNILKRCLLGYDEQFIVIDNDNLTPVHWRSYIKMANDTEIPVECIGVDVYPEENPKLKLQKQHLDTFNLEMTKYIQINNEDDIKSASLILTQLMESKT